MFNTIPILGRLNLSLSQTQPQTLNNRTIERLVKDYVVEYVGRFNVVSHITAWSVESPKLLFFGDYISSVN